MGLSGATIEAAYLAACLAELDALKPGNVHRFAGGHGMDVAVFERSARASAPMIAAAGQPVGRRILEAMRATWAVAGMNTNLGILLLCAPLAAAAEGASAARRSGTGAPSGVETLRAAIGDTLSALTAEDAANVFSAIALASPGGLGTRPEHDVRQPPTISLVEAMRIAAADDSVAAQFSDRFAAVLDLGVVEIRRSKTAGRQGIWPAIDCYFVFAAGLRDSHVARKFGAAAGEALRRRMEATRNRLNRLDNDAERLELLRALDLELKAEGVNPGTSADLTVASIFAEKIARKLEECGRG